MKREVRGRGNRREKRSTKRKENVRQVVNDMAGVNVSK